jgi:hypothetical protein
MKRPAAPPPDAKRIAAAARRLVAELGLGDAGPRGAGRIGAALPVVSADGERHSWFVPVTVGDRLAGFLQLRPDATLLRFSTFQRRPGDLEGCPAAADWLDPERIRQRAQAQRRSGEAVGEPFLSYDRSPERIAWAVPLVSATGRRLVYVAGDTVFEPAGGSGLG